jgi:ADP-heptose:LPS heptosyltransferase
MKNNERKSGGFFLLLPVGGLEDAVSYLFLTKALRCKFPASNILVVVATKEASGVIQGSVNGIEMLIFNRSKLTLKETLEVLLILRNCRLAVVISGAHPNSFRIPLLALFSGAKVRVGAEFERFSFLYNELFTLN